MNSLYIQYGCGLSAPSAWKNFDSSPTLRVERSWGLAPLAAIRRKKLFPSNVEYGDVVNGLPVSDNSCQGIYCSHVLEHLALEDCRRALANTFRYLQPHGIFRLVLPDMQFYVEEYIRNANPDACVQLMKATRLGRETRARGLLGFAREWLGNSQHLWMWDYKAMAYELQAAGFRDIRRATFRDSEDARFVDVEEAGRWENCLGIQCIK